MKHSRYLLASFTAPVAALLLPSLLALWQLNAEADLMPDGSYDDAGMRSAGLFLLVAAPVIYFVASLYYAASGYILNKANRLSRKAVVALAAVTPWSLIALATIGLVANNRSILPGLIMLAIIGIAMSLFAIVGAFVWWQIAFGSVASDA
jgi:hypothetical protein